MLKKPKVQLESHFLIDKLRQVYSKSTDFHQLFKVKDFSELPQEPQEFLDWYWENFQQGCKGCPLHSSRNHVVKYDGKVGASVFVIGEGPGFLEDLTKIPFTGAQELTVSHCNTCSKTTKCFSHKILLRKDGWQGKSKVVDCVPDYKDTLTLQRQFYIKSTGQLFNGVINSIDPNLKRQSYYDRIGSKEVSKFFITNVTRCRTTDSSGLKDTAPKHISIQACKLHLMVELFCVQPKVILCLGTEASKVMGQKDSPLGELCESKFGPIIRYYHPSYIMRDPGYIIQSVMFGKLSEAITIALNHK